MTPHTDDNNPDSKKHEALQWIVIILIVAGTLLASKLIGRQVQVSKLIEMLRPVVPVCVCFGPLFLLLGILFRTSTKPIKPSWLAIALLVAGTAMITLALLFLLFKLPAVEASGSDAVGAIRQQSAAFVLIPGLESQ